MPVKMQVESVKVLVPVKTKKAKQKEQNVKEKIAAVEDYALADEELAALKVSIEALESRKKKALAVLAPELEGKSADDPVLIVGEKHTLKFSPQQWVREIMGGSEAVKEAVGENLFMKIAKFGLGDLDKYVDAKTLALLIEQKRTGRRAVEVITNK